MEDTHTHTTQYSTETTAAWREELKKKKLGIAMYGMNRQWRKGGRGTETLLRKKKKKKAFSLDKV